MLHSAEGGEQLGAARMLVSQFPEHKCLRASDHLYQPFKEEITLVLQLPKVERDHFVINVVGQALP